MVAKREAALARRIAKKTREREREATRKDEWIGELGGFDEAEGPSVLLQLIDSGS